VAAGPRPSRPGCGAARLRGALLIRGLVTGSPPGPGPASHHFVMRRVRDTRAVRSDSVVKQRRKAASTFPRHERARGDASMLALDIQRAQGMPGADTHPRPCVQTG
jgi:hypothetical protein